MMCSSVDVAFGRMISKPHRRRVKRKPDCFSDDTV